MSDARRPGKRGIDRPDERPPGRTERSATPRFASIGALLEMQLTILRGLCSRASELLNAQR